MTFIKNNIVSLLILAVLLIIAFGGSKPAFGAAVNLTTIGNPFDFTSTGTQGGVKMASTTISAQLDQNGVKSRGSKGSCTTGTTTAATIANPYTSTSTASVIVKGSGTIATTTNLYVGTTTSATTVGISGYGAGDYKVSPSLINLTTIATSTSLYSASPSMNSFGLGPTGATFASIIVGPSERVAIFATSTSVTVTNYSFPCDYEVLWRN